MLTVRPAAERGHANYGWLDSRFTFSFADYHDPAHMGFRALRVLNEDCVAPSTGFGKHPHRDMEILTYVLDGAIKHEDTTGASETLVPGELQHMTAGSGIEHSERNPCLAAKLRFVQIWLTPNQRGLPPKYEQKRIHIQQEPNRLHLLASTDARDESFQLHADAELLAARLEAGAAVTHEFKLGHGWLQMARGTVSIGDIKLKAGDGLAITGEAAVTVSSIHGGEFLLFDLA